MAQTVEPLPFLLAVSFSIFNLRQDGSATPCPSHQTWKRRESGCIQWSLACACKHVCWSCSAHKLQLQHGTHVHRQRRSHSHVRLFCSRCIVAATDVHGLCRGRVGIHAGKSKDLYSTVHSLDSCSFVTVNLTMKVRFSFLHDCTTPCIHSVPPFKSSISVSIITPGRTLRMASASAVGSEL